MFWEAIASGVDTIYRIYIPVASRGREPFQGKWLAVTNWGNWAVEDLSKSSPFLIKESRGKFSG